MNRKQTLILAACGVLGVGAVAFGVHRYQAGVARREAIQKADNLASAKRCIAVHARVNAKTFAGECDRVDLELLPDEVKPDFSAALAKNEAIRAEEEAKVEAEAEKRRKWQAAQAQKREAERIARGEWNYTTRTDNATGKTAKYGTLISKNSMNFGSPYNGIQYGRFTVRNHPRYGIDAFLSIDRGQLLCDNYSNPNVLVRFDDGPAVPYKCSEPADYSSEYVFINNIGGLEAGMRSAKKMFITVSVYDEGSRTWEFNVRNYDRSKI